MKIQKITPVQPISYVKDSTKKRKDNDLKTKKQKHKKKVIEYV